MSTPAAMDRITLRFQDEAMERRFRASVDDEPLRIMRLAGCTGAIIILLATFWLLARGELPAEPGSFYWSGLVLLGAALTWLPAVRRSPQVGAAAICALFAPGMALGFRLFAADHIASRLFLLVILHLFTINALVRLRLAPAFVTTWVSTAVYLLAMKGWQVLPDRELAWQAMWLVTIGPWVIALCWRLEQATRREFASREEADRERARSEQLLLNILPAPIAARLKSSPERIAEDCEEVTVLFADLVGFTPLAAGRPANEVVALLDRIFTRFDEIAARHGLEKIKTIGDAYMAVAGLPHAQPDHAARAARMALELLDAVGAAARDLGEPLRVRVGLHTGPVVAGVIGRTKFSYDLWGDTVNTASRMESSGLPDAVHCSPATAQHLGGAFALQSRGRIEVKGKGEMETFLLAAS